MPVFQTDSCTALEIRLYKKTLVKKILHQGPIIRPLLICQRKKINHHGTNPSFSQTGYIMLLYLQNILYHPDKILPGHGTH